MRGLRFSISLCSAASWGAASHIRRGPPGPTERPPFRYALHWAGIEDSALRASPRRRPQNKFLRATPLCRTSGPVSLLHRPAPEIRAATSTNKKRPNKSRAFFVGRRTVTSNEPILETLHSLLISYPDIKRRLEQLHLVIDDLVHSERASSMQFLL